MSKIFLREHSGFARYDANGVITAGARFVESEGEDKSKVLGKLVGVAGEADLINKNRRKYPKLVYETAVGRAQVLIQSGGLLGEVDHPDWAGTLKRAAVRFTKLWMDGAFMRFEAVILNNDCGEHLLSLFEGGVGVQVSTRGYGSVMWEKVMLDDVEVEISVIQTDFELQGIDFVLFGSNQSNGVRMGESLSSHSQESRMNLEQLRAQYPDLVAQIEAEARQGLISESEVEARVSAAVQTAVEAVRAEDSVRLSESRGQALAAVLEAVRPFLPVAESAAAERVESDLTRQVATLEEQVRSLVASAAAATEARVQAEAETQAATAAARLAEQRATVQAHIATATAGLDFASVIQAELSECTTVEAVDALIAARKTFIEAVRVAAAAGTSADGVGRSNLENPDQELSEAAALKAREKQLAEAV